jgi:hypothetical protein
VGANIKWLGRPAITRSSDLQSFFAAGQRLACQLLNPPSRELRSVRPRASWGYCGTGGARVARFGVWAAPGTETACGSLGTSRAGNVAGRTERAGASDVLNVARAWDVRQRNGLGQTLPSRHSSCGHLVEIQACARLGSSCSWACSSPAWAVGIHALFLRGSGP